jgi:hypothetical protein
MCWSPVTVTQVGGWRKGAEVVLVGGGEVRGRWFGDNVVTRVGDGTGTLFWTH